MFPFLQILSLILQGLPSSVFNPYFWIVILLVWIQYKRAAALEISMFGKPRIEPGKKVLFAVGAGALGGLAGSIAVIMIGMSITEAGLIYVWPLALLLALADPHLMCFSYAGGIVSLFSLVFGFPKIDVPGLMALVAILHLVESLLIYFTGHINATPIYIKDPRHGAVGGFSLQEFWPVPIILLLAVSSPALLKDSLSMPDWWPLIKPPAYITENPDLVFMMFPVVAALGYGDIALTTTPRLRSTVSAKHLLAFSSALLALSVMASRNGGFSFAAALFAPAAHELLIITGRKREQNNPPIFVASPRGERVFFTVKDSHAEKMGLSSGDLILSVNGRELKSPGVLPDILADYPPYVWITYETLGGKVKTAERQSYPNGIGDLGVVLVPRDGIVPTVEIQKKATLLRLLERFRKKKG